MFAADVPHCTKSTNADGDVNAVDVYRHKSEPVLVKFLYDSTTMISPGAIVKLAPAIKVILPTPVKL